MLRPPRVYHVLLEPAAEPLGSQPRVPASECWDNVGKDPFPVRTRLTATALASLGWVRTNTPWSGVQSSGYLI